jgi:hypothetical protein
MAATAAIAVTMMTSMSLLVTAKTKRIISSKLRMKPKRVRALPQRSYRPMVT